MSKSNSSSKLSTLTSATSGPLTYSLSAPSIPSGHSTSVPAGTWQAPSHWSTSQLPAIPKKVPRAKKRTQEEKDITARVAANVKIKLEKDHTDVLKPNIDDPFVDTEDVIRRLLPYHVYQLPQEDRGRDVKGKRKATNEELEIEETRFAIRCHKRLRNLEKRFKDVRHRSGKRPSPSDQAVVLGLAVVEAERVQNSLVNSELRSVRQEYDRIGREKRIAQAAAARPQYYVPQTGTVAGQSYYRYPYSLAYATSQQTVTGTHTAAPAAPNTAPNPAPTPLPPTQAAAAAAVLAGAPIPVQLPVSSLPQLKELGITPVPASAVPEGTRPPAILKSSSANGTTLNLEICVALLQPSQMSGLALILNNLMARSSALAHATPPAPASNGV